MEKENTQEKIFFHSQKGKKYYREGLREEAISEFNQVLRYAPFNQEALFYLVRLYTWKGEKEKEKAFYLLAWDLGQRLLKLDPQKEETYDLLIELAIKSNQVDKLVEKIRENLREFPNQEVLQRVHQKLQVASLASIPQVKREKISSRTGCLKRIFLDFLLPFSGIIVILLALLVSRFSQVRGRLLLIGSVILVGYFFWKIFSYRQKSRGW